MLLNGRVVGLDEMGLSFGAAGVVRAIPIDQGQTVRSGQVLMELDATQLTRDLAAARVALDTSTVRLQQVQARVQAETQVRQRAYERRLREEEQRRATAIAESERAVNRATADLEVVKAGATSAERAAAAAAVAAARAALERARLEQVQLTRGPDPDEVRTAEGALLQAEASLAAAQAELATLTRGPTEADIRAAERRVERAQIGVSAARAMDPERTTAAARAAALAEAELDVRVAQEELAYLRQPPPAEEVDVLRRRVEVARFAVEGARQRLERVRKGPEAQAINSAGAAVASAAAALTSAEARAAELNTRPAAADVQDAQARVAIALATLEFARAEVDVARDEDATAAYDVLMAQRQVERDRSQTEALERDVAQTRLTAPYAATVVAIRTQVGGTVEAGRPVIVISRSGAPLVEAAIMDADAARLERGLRATVQLDGGDGTRSGASLVDLVRTATGTIARLQVAWSNARPSFGATARVRITLQEHADSLLVPRQAVRTAGNRQFVEYFDGAIRRTADVQLGILTPESAEVLSGLEEGQLVVVSP